MKRFLSTVLAFLLTVSCFTLSASAYWEGEEAFQNVCFNIGERVESWTPDGSINEGEYYQVDIDPSWLSYAINDNDAEAGLAYAKSVNPELYMSWDANYVYMATRYEVTNGHENLWDGDPSSMWYSGCIQINYTNLNEVASEYRLEYGVGLSSDTGDMLYAVWADGIGSGYTPTEDDAMAWLDGNTLTYETRCPWDAFADEDNTGYQVGNGFNFCLVWSFGEGQDYVQIQLAEGCTGNGKHAENFAKVTLTEAAGDEFSLSVIEGASHSAKLEWTNLTGSNLVYKVYRDGELIGETTGTQYSDRGFEMYGVQTYKVEAYSDDILIAESNEIEYLPANYMPDPPSVFDPYTYDFHFIGDTAHIEGGIVLDNSIMPLDGDCGNITVYWEGNGQTGTFEDFTLTWINDSDGYGNRIDYRADWDISSLSDGEYWIDFSYTDIDGESAEAFYTCNVIHVSLPALQNVTAVAPDGFEVELRWEVPEGVNPSSYRIYRSSDMNPEWDFVEIIDVDDGSITEYVDSVPPEYGTVGYSYTVLYIDEYGNYSYPSEYAYADAGDSVLPWVSNIIPEEGTILDGIVEFVIDLEDNDALLSCEINVESVIDGNVFSDYYNLSGISDQVIFTIDTSNISEGDIYINLTIYDDVYNEGYWTFTYTVSHNNPEPLPVRTIESNGHTYAYYNTYLPWQDAKTFCEENGGYLMTVTTAGEQDILAQLNEADEGIFLGGYRVDEDSWAWVTGEEFIYSNWNDGEPSNGNGGEPESYVGSFEGAGSRWNDFPENPTDVAGFIMETGDPEPVPIRSAEYNGHSYYYFNTYLPWQEAKAFCEEHGGYLMTVTTAGEQSILAQLNVDDEGIFLGGYRTEGDDFAWVTGETFLYSNWNEGEPNNGLGAEPEDYIGAFVGTGSGWNDFPENPTDVAGFILEVGENFSDVNIIPTTGIETLDLTDKTNGFTFKVYDDGGAEGNYSDSCYGELVITAPEDCVLQVTGIANTESIDLDYLQILERHGMTDIYISDIIGGNPDIDIGIYTTTVNTMVLRFVSDASVTYEGLDLTVKVINKNILYDIESNPENGNVIISVDEEVVTQAKVNDIVTITAIPDEGYVLDHVEVMGINGRVIEVEGGSWISSVATFVMPNTDVIVTPVFIAYADAIDSCAINIPASSYISLDITDKTNGFTFKVYDDGGAEGNYSVSCDGELVITAPEDCVLQVTGIANTESIDFDYLQILERHGTTDMYISDNIGGNPDIDIGIYTTTVNTMIFRFASDVSATNAGLDLTVKVIDKNILYNIESNPENGNATFYVNEEVITKAKVNDIITITTIPDEGYVLDHVEVVGVNGRVIEVEGGSWISSVATFVMPNTDVIVTPVFIAYADAIDSCAINIPASSYISLDITDKTNGFTFKVYDDGGAEGNYSDNCYGELVITAPEDCVLQVTGIANTESINLDYLQILERHGTTDMYISDYIGGNPDIDIGIYTTTVNTMILRFASDVSATNAGLDLTVKVIDKNCIYYAIDQGACGDNLTWTLYNTGDLIISGTGDMWDYSLSDETGYSTAPWTAYRTQLVNLIIEEGATSIGNYAFYMSELQNSLTFPSTLTSIGIWAFGGSFNIPGSLTLPDSVTSIGGWAFWNCPGITGTLAIPSSVETIGWGAFALCDGLTAIEVTEYSPYFATYEGALYTSDYSTLICCPAGKTEFTYHPSVTTIGEYAFAKCTGLTGNLEIPDTVVDILGGAFSWCTGFTGELVIPDSVTGIGWEAFSGCTGLTGTLVLPDNLTYIGEHAFQGCSGFTGNLIIPASVGSVWGEAFEGCVGIESVTFAGNAPEVHGEDIFENSITLYCYEEYADSFTSDENYYESVGTWYGYHLEVITDDAVETFEDGVKLNAKSVSLSGNIGVNLKMTVPEQYVDSSYMTFTVHGRTTTIQTNTLEPNTKGQYVFTAYITSIEMAEQIQAVFTYGDYTATMTYSVADYINAYDAVSGSYAAEITSLVHALADYGHHAQTFLSKYRSWTIGNQYAEMNGYNDTYTDSELAAAQANVANYALNYTTNANVEKVNISLNLESETSIYVYLTPVTGYTGKVTCAEGYAVEKIGARYRVTIPNVMAHQLGNTYTLHLTTTAGTIEVNVSALSYANSIFNSDTMNEVDRYFAVALYNYYQSAVAYLGN